MCKHILLLRLPTWAMTIVWIALIFTTFFGWPSSRKTVRSLSKEDNELFQDPNNIPRWLDPNTIRPQLGRPKDDPNGRPDTNPVGPAGPTANGEGIEMEFEKVVKEIQMRLEHEHSLYLYQFVLIGGVLTVLVGTSGLLRRPGSEDKIIIEQLYEKGSLFLGLGVMALAVLIVDIHIRFNILVVQSLGDWIRIHYEPFHVFPATGWELFWRSAQNEHFRRWDSLLYMMLYLPTIAILSGFYLMLFRQPEKPSPTMLFRQLETPSPTLKYLQKGVFVGVQISIALFAVINRRPTLSMPPGELILTLVWTLAFLLVFWQGWVRLR